MKRLFGIATGLLVLTSCGSTAAPAPRPLPALPGHPLLLLTSGGNYPQLVLWDVTSRAARQTLPYGTVSPDGRLLYTVDGGAGRLEAIDVASGQTVAKVAIPNGFQLPQGSLASSLPMALSPNGAWIALQSFDGAAPSVTTRSRYLVVDSTFRTHPRMINLEGRWDFDAVSNDGQRLYLLQDMTEASGPYTYKVRLYDLAGGGLLSQVIFDKRLWGETMTGARLVGVPAHDQSWLYSLYTFGPYGPFIHALSLDGSRPVAWCVNLPDVSNGDELQAMLWTLVRSGDGQHLYAINAGEGVAAEIALSGDSPPVVSRKTRFAVHHTAATSFLGLIVNAEAKRFLVGGAVLSPDGRIVYVVGENGIYAIAADSLKARREYLVDVPIDSVVVSADGKTLFASSSERNKLFRIDARTGQSEVLTDSVQVNGLVTLEAS